jgi:hypothetical protein
LNFSKLAMLSSFVSLSFPVLSISLKDVRRPSYQETKLLAARISKKKKKKKKKKGKKREKKRRFCFFAHFLAKIDDCNHA